MAIHSVPNPPGLSHDGTYEGTTPQWPARWHGAATAAALFALAIVFFFLGGRIDRVLVIPFVPEYRGERCSLEMFARLLTLFIFVGGLVTARAAASAGLRRAAAVFACFGVLLYAGETNMVANKLQPLLAVVIGPTLLWLVGRHARRAFVPLVLGGVFVAMGIVADTAQETDLTTKLPALTAGVCAWLARYEDGWDLLGIACFVFAAWSLRRGVMERWVQRAGRLNIELMLACSIAVVVGQSVAHWSYTTPLKTAAVCHALGLFGTLGVLWINERRLVPGVRLGTADRGLFIAMGFLAGAVVPFIYRAHDGRLDLFFWPVIMLAIAWYLQRARWEAQAPGETA